MKLFYTKRAVQTLVDDHEDTVRRMNEAADKNRAALPGLIGSIREANQRVDRLIADNERQSSTIISLSDRLHTVEQELDATRQELDAWKKRFDQLAVVSVAQARDIAEQDEQLDAADQLLSDSDEVIAALVEQLEAKPEKKRKGKNG